jgi:hypothetical protein
LALTGSLSALHSLLREPYPVYHPFFVSDHLENNRSGKRGKALSGIPAVPAQDPESGIIEYRKTDREQIKDRIHL